MCINCSVAQFSADFYTIKPDKAQSYVKSMRSVNFTQKNRTTTRIQQKDVSKLSK